MIKTLLVMVVWILAVGCGKNSDPEAPPPSQKQPLQKQQEAQQSPVAMGEKKMGEKEPAPKPSESNDEFAGYTALDVGADYKSWEKLNKKPVLSKTHGRRFVDTYVNKVGVAAYKDGDADIPVGTIVVKTSWEAKGGKPSDVPGPIFIMKRIAASTAGGEPSWWYGLHWEKVPAEWQDAIGASQAYWRTPSKKVGYCSECHDKFPRELGGIPKKMRNY